MVINGTPLWTKIQKLGSSSPPAGKLPMSPSNGPSLSAKRTVKFFSGLPERTAAPINTPFAVTAPLGSGADLARDDDSGPTDPQGSPMSAATVAFPRVASFPGLRRPRLLQSTGRTTRPPLEESLLLLLLRIERHCRALLILNFISF